jgi:hypothetical protein
LVQSPEPIEELHLSHNLLTNQGAAQLLWSVGRCAAAFLFRRATAARACSRRCAVIRRSLTHAAFSLLCYTVPSETVPVVCLPRAVRQCKQHAFEPQRKRRCTRGAFARYPRHEAQRAVPLWLRLDFNMLDSARLLPLCCAEADPTKPDVRRPREIKASPHCRSCAQPGSPCRTTCPHCRMLAKPCKPHPRAGPPRSACACRLFV